MDQRKLEGFIKDIGNRHLAVLIAVKRAKQLQQGLRPLFEGKRKKLTTMALEEMIEGRLEYTFHDLSSEKDIDTPDSDAEPVEEEQSADTEVSAEETAG